MTSTLKILSRPQAQDCLFLAIIVVISISFYTSGLGFYGDDWALLASMRLSPDQSLAGMFAELTHYHDNEIRPIQFLEIAVLYKIFDLNPLGYHLVNGLFLLIGFVLLYFVMRKLRQPRVLALSVCTVYALLPNYSTDRFWISSSVANVSMCLFFLGILAHLRALDRRKYEYWGWETFAILCVIGSGFAYEVFLPLFLLAAAILFISELHADPRRSASMRTIGKTALRQAPILITVAIVGLIKAFWAPRVPANLEVISYLAWTGRAILKAVLVSYGNHLLLMPVTVCYALIHYANPTMVVTAALIGMLVLGRFYTLPDQPASSAAKSRARMFAYLGCGIALFVAGYSLFPLNPAENGTNNRTAIAGTLGVAVSVVGLVGLLTSFAPEVWRRALFSATIALIGVGGVLIIDAVAKFWVASYRLQAKILSEIHDHIKFIPDGGTLILDGVCPYYGPAPIFRSPWDLSGALALLYGHANIGANIVTRSATIGADGLTATEERPVTYPFGKLYVYHYKRKQTYALPDFETAQSYFNDVSVDRMTRCPDDVNGNGVDVLNGLVTRLREHARQGRYHPRSR
jgi:hypothetical protein